MQDGKTRINLNPSYSRMIDGYDWMIGKMLDIGAYSGKQKMYNQFIHNVFVPYLREHHREYVPAGQRHD